MKYVSDIRMEKAIPVFTPLYNDDVFQGDNDLAESAAQPKEGGLAVDFHILH